MQFWDSSVILPVVVRQPPFSDPSLQLGCAQGLAPQGDTDALPEFVCCDRRLAEAAAAEGFALVIGP